MVKICVKMHNINTNNTPKIMDRFDIYFRLLGNFQRKGLF